MPFYHRVNYQLMKILLDFYLVTSISIRSAHPRLKSGATFLYADFFLKLY